MDLLVLGGTPHMGRSIIEAAARRGDTVTIVNRGLSGRPPAGVEARLADRTRPGALAKALGDDRWDAVIDTWAWLCAEGEPEPPDGRPPLGLDPERERAVLVTVTGNAR
ncbi:hypothetical protein [Streptosporangium sp. NPDC023615]|uniref:hypothetical protein n=1 Tax=Streptosporangium sp. NPDC023615 TaxID=3154794 RepID=UPI003419D115